MTSCNLNIRFKQVSSKLFNSKQNYSISQNFNVFIVSAIKQFLPTDATTNPSLILAASKIEKYAKIIDQAVDYGKKHAE